MKNNSKRGKTLRESAGSISSNVYLWGGRAEDRRAFFYEFTHLNSQCFQIFLELVSEYFADSILIIQLDNGRFHKAKNLKIPDNIILMFQPPHCPESNPIEQIWQYLKKGLRWKLPRDLEELRLLIGQRLEEMNKEVIASIVGRGYILDALSVVGI